MKTKRLIALFSVLAVLTVIVILCSTVFTIKNVTIEWKIAKSELSSTSDGDIVSEMPYGSSIFFVDKDKAIQNMEKKYPYIKIINVETKFPSSLVVHATERVGVYAIKTDHDYALVDEENKVLSFVTQVELASWDESVKGAKPIIVTATQNDESMTLLSNDFVVGNVSNVSRISALISSFATSLQTYGYPNNEYIKAFADSISIETGFHGSLVVNTTYGLKIKITNAYTDLDAKVQMAVSIYNEKHNQSVTTGTITVYVDSNNSQVVGDYENV